MLTVVDNLSRALEHLPAEAHASADPSIRSLIEGVELTARDLETVLGRHGVKKLDPKGQKFDPNFHQAIFEAPDETVPSGTVSQVVQSGWTIGDRVLRPAMVGVSKGGPKAAPRQEPAASREIAVGRPGDSSERQIDPAALRQKGRGAGHDAVNAVEGEPALARKLHGVARGEAEGAGRRITLQPSDPEQGGVAER